jgi:enoyl-CoA hydratase
VIRVQEHGPVVVVRLDHGKVNAMDIELLHELTATMRRLAGAPAIVVTGTGKTFSAGVDLVRIVDGGPAYVRQYLPALSTAFLAVFDHPGPVVAAVNGHAIAGGCILAAACDVRFMSGGTIGLTELRVGVPFPVAAMEIARYAAGTAVGGLALTGETVDPQEARRRGLVDEVVAPEELLAAALHRAGALARTPAAAYALTKEQLHRPVRRRIEEMGLLDDPLVTAMWESEAARTAIKAYLDGLAARRSAAAAP